MKSNKKNLNIISKFKYYMLIPIVLLIVAIVFGCVFGLNYDYDFRNISTFDVKFNTTVSTSEYKELEKQLDALVDTKFDDYRIEKVGEGAQNGLTVKIANDEGDFNQTIEDMKETIESSLLVNCGDVIESNIVVTTSDTTTILPKNISDLIWYSVLAIVCILAFVFIYYVIRYNFVSSISFVLTILFEIAMLTIVMIVARVPFNYYFVVSYFVMIMASVFVSTYINNNIRGNLNSEKYEKYSNSDRVYDAFGKTLKPVLIFTTLMILTVFAVMFFGNLTLLYIVLSILCGYVVMLFGTYMFEFSLWSFWYKREKDATLKRRLELEKKRLENANKKDDKIVV